MEDPDMAGQTASAQRASEVVGSSIDTLFHWAPVMMHSIGRDGRLIRVNRRWVQRLGYTEEEALGRKSTEFLTEESRARALKDTLPLFWGVGSARSVGYRLVGKDGRILDLCMDAELVRGSAGEPQTLAALYGPDDLSEWELASTAIRSLLELSRMRRTFEIVLPDKEGNFPDRELQAASQTFGWASDSALKAEAISTLLEVGKDISSNLRGLARVQEDWLGSSAEQQREMMMLLRSIDGTLRDLADSVAELAQTPDKDSPPS